MIVRSAGITLRARPRGNHLVTDEILAGIDLRGIAVGTCHLFLKHTSAALALNEDASPAVRSDLANILDRLVPERADYRHAEEGPDDLPAHAKAVLLGPSLLLPVRDGRLALGTWQGIWLCEFRDQGGSRMVLVTVLGQSAE